MQKAVHDHRAHDFLEFLYSLAVVALALLGMGGIVYHTLAPDGWIQPWLARLWANHPGMAILVLVGVVTMAMTSRSKVDRGAAFKGRGDAPLYVVVALGTLFFGARWVLNGAM